MTKTRKEVEQLKSNWESDPCWDIEETEGYEFHYGELMRFRIEKEAEWAQQHTNEILKKADALLCSFSLAEYLVRLEEKIDAMNEAISRRWTHDETNL